MTDYFSSAYDSARNFFRRRWRWVVGALVLYFIVGNWPAVSLGYAETVTQTVIENGKPVDKEMTSWLSPSAQFFRDWRDVLIGIATTIVFVMMLWRKIVAFVITLWRKIAPNHQSKATREQAKIDNPQAQHDRDRIAGEQFSDAVKLLAQKDAKNKPAIDASIGGIYYLQILANNHIKEYGAQVVKTLIVYIKQNAQLTAQLIVQPPLKENETPKEARESETPKEARVLGDLGEDVKTAFNVLEQLLAAREQDSAEWNKPPDGIRLSDRDLSFSDQDFSWLDLSASQVGGLRRYIWIWVNMQGASLNWVDLQGADLMGAQLQGASLLGVDLRGANLSGAQLQGANLSGAQLQYTDLSGAKLDDETILPSDLSENLPAKIWHSGRQPKLSEIASLLPDAEWDLTPFLHSGYVLVGVLRNFSGRRKFLAGKDVIRAKTLRKAMRKLLDEKKLPEDFPQDWQDWLGEIESDGSHPDD